MDTDSINVLILDETAESRRILQDVVAAMPRVVSCGAAEPNGGGFARIPREQADVVLLSANAGLDTLRVLLRRHPDVGVIMVSDADRPQANLTMAAIEAGALGFARRPTGRRPGDG